MVNWQQSSVENLFVYRGPIKERRYFFGRVEETHEAFHFLRGDQCLSIVGPRRIGKTSFLHHLCDAEVQREHGLEKDRILTYVDCQGLGDWGKMQLYAWLWQEARKELVKRGKAREWRESVADFREFRAMILDTRKNGFRLIFLLDEFETIATNPHLDRNFFSNLRSLAPEVSYVTASADPLNELRYAERSVLNSPFFNYFKEIPLRFLKPEEARGMIRELLEMSGTGDLFTQEDLNFLFSISGYHPFFLQLACYHLFKYRLEQPDSTQQEREKVVRDRYINDARPHFQYIWRQIKPEEREAVRQICAGETNQLSSGSRRLLEQQCILRNGKLFSTAFAAFVKDQYPQDTVGVGTRAKRYLQNVLRHFFQKPFWIRLLITVVSLLVLSLCVFGPETLFLMGRAFFFGASCIKLPPLESAECGKVSLKVFKPDFILCGKEKTVQVECYDSPCCNRDLQIDMVPLSSSSSIQLVVDEEEEGTFKVKCEQGPGPFDSLLRLTSPEPLALMIRAGLDDSAPVEQEIEIRTSYLASFLQRIVGIFSVSILPIVRELREGFRRISGMLPSQDTS